MDNGCNRMLMVAQDFFSGLLDGDTLIEFQMDSFLLFLIFRWLIHVSTLADM
jgi:hypothetical protein